MRRLAITWSNYWRISNEKTPVHNINRISSTCRLWAFPRSASHAHFRFVDRDSHIPPYRDDDTQPYNNIYTHINIHSHHYNHSHLTTTPTFAFSTATVNKQAHCRYGPSTAYLHAADLYPGDIGSVRGRAVYSQWLQIKFDKINYFCWVAPSVVDVAGDISNIDKVTPNLQSIGLHCKR